MNAEYHLEREALIRKPRAAVFDFFSRAENLEKITPPWLGFRILTPPPIEMKVGTRIEYEIRVHGLSLKWLTEIEVWNPPFEFVDVQLRGPYRVWRHTHLFEEAPGGTRVVDRVSYALPLGILGRLLHRVQVRRDVQQIFDYRARRIQQVWPR